MATPGKSPPQIMTEKSFPAGGRGAAQASQKGPPLSLSQQVSRGSRNAFDQVTLRRHATRQGERGLNKKEKPVLLANFTASETHISVRVVSFDWHMRHGAHLEVWPERLVTPAGAVSPHGQLVVIAHLNACPSLLSIQERYQAASLTRTNAPPDLMLSLPGRVLPALAASASERA